MKTKFNSFRKFNTPLIKNIFNVVFLLLSFLLIVIYSVNCFTPKSESISSIVINQGQLNINQLKSLNKSYYLKGDFDYFPGQLKYSEPTSYDLQTKDYQSFPFRNFNEIDKVNDVYCATYEITLTCLNTTKPLVVYSNNADFGYKIYLNGDLLSYNGTLSTNKNELNFNQSFEINFLDIIEEANVITIEYASLNKAKLTSIPMITSYAHFQDDLNTQHNLSYLILGATVTLVAFTLLVYLISRKNLFSLEVVGLFFIQLLFIFNNNAFNGMWDFLHISQSMLISILLALLTYFGLIFLRITEKDFTIKPQKKLYFSIIAANLLFFIISLIPKTQTIGLLTLYIISILVMLYNFIISIIKVNKKVKYAFINGLLQATGIILVNVYVLTFEGLIPSSLYYVNYLLFLFSTILLVGIYASKGKTTYETILTASKVQQELNEANASLLLSQIQPHFIYNTLNTVKYLIHNNPKQAEFAVVKFSQYLRANMKSMEKKYSIRFNEELEHTRNYVAIELIRFGDHLKVVEDIRTIDFYIPPLTLEPLVENAIKHGASKRINGGKVRIETFEDQENFYVRVIDNGIGFDVSILEQESASIGIKNIRRRLKIMTNAELFITSKIKQGTTSIITLPKKDNQKYLEKEEESEN